MATSPSDPLPHPSPRPLPPRAGLLGVALLAAVLLPAAARADVQITLQNSFIDKLKDRVTVEASLTLEKPHAGPGKPAADGGLRVAGRAPEIGLATAAEVMNAAGQPEAVNLVHQAEQGGQPLALRGVWRLWCERGGDLTLNQGEAAPPADAVDPAPVFAIHPVLQAGTLDVGGALRPAEGSVIRDAAEAFRGYEQLSSHVATGAGTTTITTRMADPRYVEFVVRLNEEPSHLLADGLAVNAAILDAAGETLVRERRIVAAAGTAPYARLKALHKGGTLRVVGVPRLDLALLSWRIANRSRIAGVLDWSLPYEMVVVAALDDGPDAPASPAAAAGDAGGAGGAGRPAAGAGALVAPATPGSSAEGDVIVTLLQLLGQSLPSDAVRGACSFSSGQRSYCASLSGPQCDQLGGAFNAGDDCPAAGPPLPAPAAPPAPLAPAAPPPGGTGEVSGSRS